jgi:predicted DNA-binding transcriptional regulator YafY
MLQPLMLTGVPVYAQRGPGGGITLLDSFRTDLTGLNTAELQALMILSVPAPLRELGFGPDLKSALRKVGAAAQLTRRKADARLQDKFFIDSSEWVGTAENEPLFEIGRKALWGDVELAISYHSELGRHAGHLTAVIQPLGLVAAAGSWYLVAGIERDKTVIPFARIQSSQIMAEHFNPPQDFILESLWQDWMIRFRSQRPFFIV